MYLLREKVFSGDRQIGYGLYDSTSNLMIFKTVPSFEKLLSQNQVVLDKMQPVKVQAIDHDNSLFDRAMTGKTLERAMQFSVNESPLDKNILKAIDTGLNSKGSGAAVYVLGRNSCYCDAVTGNYLQHLITSGVSYSSIFYLNLHDCALTKGFLDAIIAQVYCKYEYLIIDGYYYNEKDQFLKSAYRNKTFGFVKSKLLLALRSDSILTQTDFVDIKQRSQAVIHMISYNEWTL